MSKGNHIVVSQNMLLIKPLTPKLTPIPIRINSKDKIRILKGEKGNEILKNIKLNRNVFQEDIIYESQPGDFLRGDSHKVTIVNRKNLLTNSSQTIAKYTSLSERHISYTQTSDIISKLIGQENYDTVFSALCSVINQEAKIRGMLALLKTQKRSEDAACQTDMVDVPVKCNEAKSYNVKSCQTDENCRELIYRWKNNRNTNMKRFKRTAFTPYIVKDYPPTKKRKVVINPHSSDRLIVENLKEGIKLEKPEKTDEDKKHDLDLPDIKDYLSDDSNEGSIGNLSVRTGMSNPNFAQNLLDQIQGHTADTEENSQMEIEPTYIKMLDGSQILVTVKPEDKFHIATPEILKNVTNEERERLLWYQATIDWKCCLERDEDDYLPIHSAVQNNDLDLLRRQCIVLRNRQESLDLTAGNYTALQMSIFQDNPQCMAMLLRYGADPLFADDEERTPLHLAAEATSDHVRVLLQYCRENARHILQEHDMWSPGLELRTDEELATHLVVQMCDMFDCQGYTPLMTASKIGNYCNVKLLAEASPSSVNKVMPNSGNTPLFIAVSASCIDASERGNRSKLADHFYRTVEILIENGADPTIDNYSGATVNELMIEYNVNELSLLVANKLTAVKYGIEPGIKNFDKIMLVKDEKGTVNIRDIDKKPKCYAKGNVDKDKSELTTVKYEVEPGIKTFDTVMLVKDEKGTVNIKDIDKKPKSKDTGNISKEKLAKFDSDKETKLEKEADKSKPIILENISLPVIRKVVTELPIPSLAPRNLKTVSPKDKIVAAKLKPLNITIKDIRTMRSGEIQCSVGQSTSTSRIVTKPPLLVEKVQRTESVSANTKVKEEVKMEDIGNVSKQINDNKRKIVLKGPNAKKKNTQTD